MDKARAGAKEEEEDDEESSLVGRKARTAVAAQPSQRWSLRRLLVPLALLAALLFLLTSLAVACMLLVLTSLQPMRADLAFLLQESVALKSEKNDLRQRMQQLQEVTIAQYRRHEEMKEELAGFRAVSQLQEQVLQESAKGLEVLQQELKKLSKRPMPSDGLDEVARLILRHTDSGGLVSEPRKLATLRLSLRALLEGVEGDFLEAGVFNGGTAVLMTRVLEIYAPKRLLWAADSFEGLPKEGNMTSHVKGSGGVLGARASDKEGKSGEFAAGVREFQDNLAKFKLNQTGQVKVLKGWFKDTLPSAPFKRLSFLRADGDIYISTKETLEATYERLAVGGFAYFDDYGSFFGCKRAVDEFRERHNLTEPMMPVYENLESGLYEAVWWQKRRQLKGGPL